MIQGVRVHIDHSIVGMLLRYPISNDKGCFCKTDGWACNWGSTLRWTLDTKGEYVVKITSHMLLK
jgi:hypothetical protein